MLLLLAAVLAASPVESPPLKLAVMDVTGVDLPAEKLGFLTEVLATRLSQAGAQVTTSQTISAVLGL